MIYIIINSTIGSFLKKYIKATTRSIETVVGHNVPDKFIVIGNSKVVSDAFFDYYMQPYFDFMDACMAEGMSISSERIDDLKGAKGRQKIYEFRVKYKHFMTSEQNQKFDTYCSRISDFLRKVNNK